MESLKIIFFEFRVRQRAQRACCVEKKFSTSEQMFNLVRFISFHRVPVTLKADRQFCGLATWSDSEVEIMEILKYTKSDNGISFFN